MSKRGENITKRKDGRWEARVLKGYRQDGRALYKFLYAPSYSEAKRKKTEYMALFNLKGIKKNKIDLDEFLKIMNGLVDCTTEEDIDNLIKETEDRIE